MNPGWVWTEICLFVAEILELSDFYHLLFSPCQNKSYPRVITSFISEKQRSLKDKVTQTSVICEQFFTVKIQF